MKLTIKNLKQVAYLIEIPEESNVSQLKEEIETKHAFDSKSIKLLYNGMVLEDQKLLSEYGLKDGHVIMMMSAKARPQNVIKEEKKVEEPLPSSNVKVDSFSKVASLISDLPKKKESKEIIQAPPKDYTKEIQQLSEMGFSGELSKKGIEAAKGNLNLAIDYLYNGIPSASNQNAQNPLYSEFLDEDEEGEALELDPEMLNNLDLQDPNTLNTIASIVKVIIQEDASQLANLLSEIEDTNPEIIDYIKQHETEFKNLIAQPITQEDIVRFSVLAPAGQQYADEEGDELADESLPEGLQEGLQGILNSAQNYEQANQQISTDVNLSQTDKEAVERLKILGFTEIEAVQAYMACDKNETLAANFLFDSKYNDMNVDYDESENHDNSKK